MSAGYDFVPLPEKARRAERDNNRHDRRLPQYMQALIEVEFIAEEPIHIGSGSRALQNGKVVKEAAKIEGRPGVPGSSLRGALRARLEAITRSCCISGAPRGARLGPNLPSRSYPDHQVEFAPKVLNHDAFQRCEGRQLCLACSIFGHMGVRSRLSVHDLHSLQGTSFVTKAMPQLFSPRPHHLGNLGTADIGNQRIVINDLLGRKFHQNGGPKTDKSELIEVIPIGVALEGKLSLSNASAEEIGALLAVLGEEPQSFLKIGSGKAHDFGALALSRVDVQLRQGGKLIAANDAQFEQWHKAFRESPDRWQNGLDRLVQIHALEGGEP